MSKENVSLKKGSSANLSKEPKEAGKILFETNTGNMYVDTYDPDTSTNVNDLKRVRVTDTSKLSVAGGTITGDLTVNGKIGGQLNKKLTVGAKTFNNSADVSLSLSDFGAFTATAQSLPTTSSPTVSVNGNKFTFGIPKGEQGEKGSSAKWWSGTEVNGITEKDLPEPNWANSSSDLYVTYDGKRCMRMGQTVVNEIAWNGAWIARTFDLTPDKVVDLSISLDYYWKQQDQWCWWHFRTINKDGTGTPDNGYGTLIDYGLVPNKWDTVTINRKDQILGLSGSDDLYINIHDIGPEGYLYICGITFTAIEKDGTVHSAVWGEPLLTSALDGDMYLNTETGNVYRLQSGRWQYQTTMPIKNSEQSQNNYWDYF